MNVEIPVNIQFKQLFNSTERISIFQGGTRSGKTYAILQYLLYCLLTKKNIEVITIFRKEFSTIRKSVLKDFLDILYRHDLSELFHHNKLTATFTLKSNPQKMILFSGSDKASKLRGTKRNIAFLNEANQFTREDFLQIIWRTSDKIILDYNPSDAHHWIYTDLIDTKKAELFISTYKNNPYLSAPQREEIESLKYTDPIKYRVFAKGERAIISHRLVYKGFEIIGDTIEFPGYQSVVGIDLGYTNSPTAIILVKKDGSNLYIKEILYKTKMSTEAIANVFKINKLNRYPCYCDPSDPRSIDEFRALGIPVKKGKNDVSPGISYLQTFKFYVTTSSENVINEIKFYSFEYNTTTNIISNKVIKENDHALDALRYAVYTHFPTQIPWTIA